MIAMPLTLTSDQIQVRDGAKRFFSEQSPISQFRAYRASSDPAQLMHALWHKLADLGYPAVAINETYGGLGLGLLTLGAVIEESARSLCASPLFGTAVMGAAAIELAGSEAQRQELLPAICDGSRTVAVALDEGIHHDPTQISTRANLRGECFVITGRKSFVVDGGSANLLIVSAQLDDETATPALFLVDRSCNGLTVTPMMTADRRDLAHIELDRVSIPREARLHNDGAVVIDMILDRGRACLAAEMLGGITECFARTMSYLQEREQFGVKIGSFQALKHRAARMYTEIELTRSAVVGALSALDSGADDAPALCSLAKARANDTYRLVTNESVQMHGGIGVTDELDIGLFLKRSRVLISLLGDSGFHRNRYATLLGY